MKILVAIANYGTKNDIYLDQVLEQYRALPYEKDIVVHTNIHKDLGTDVKVVVGLPTPDPRSLPYAHRRLFIECADEYDLFIYTEDDTLLTSDHIEAFLEVTQYLPDNHVAGFFRYELTQDNRVDISTIHAAFHWWPDSVKNFGSYTFAEFSNKHSALYLLTRSQLRIAIDSGAYSLTPQRSRYYVMESAASNPFLYCGLTKVMCLSQLDRFLVHHLPNKYLGKFGLPKEEVDVQVKTLMEVASGSLTPSRLFETETKLLNWKFDKSYYAPCDPELLQAVDSGYKDVLSVGCGSGNTEVGLLQKGHQVTAIPLDAVIAATASRKGIKTVEPDFNAALNTLSGRQFDCIIFDDVLPHLQEPIPILTHFANLLKEKGQIIITCLNTKYRQFTSETFAPLDLEVSGKTDFETLGIHLTNEAMVRSWLHQSGLEVKRVSYSIPQNSRMQMYKRLSLGLLASKLAPRFLIFAKRQQ